MSIRKITSHGKEKNFNVLSLLFLLLILTPILANAKSPPAIRQGPVATYAIIGDVGMPGRGLTELRRSILDSRILRLIMPGDNLYDLTKTYALVWDSWHRRGLEFPVVAIGNHTAGYDEEVAYFHMPGEFYSKVDNGIRFIVLNSDNTSTARAQATFLRAELAAAPERVVFVVFHHPPLTISNRHGWQERSDFHRAVRPVLKEYSERISGLILGHDHIAGLYALNGMPMIVSGAGVEAFKPRPAQGEEDGLRIETKWLYKGVPTWTRLDVVHSTGEIWLNFVDLKSDRVSCSALISVRPAQLKPHCFTSPH